jgi:uncharacterized membrane protein YqjE
MATSYTPPSILAEKLPFSPDQALSVIFTLLFIVWAIFTLIALYHWVRYARNRWVTVPALTVHVAVSAALFLFIVSGFH